MLADIRYALRTLASSPGLTLALGIGANTAIFTAVYGVLLKPLPYGEPDRLVRVSETRRGGSWNVAYPNYVDWRARNHVFEDMAIFNTIGRVILPGDGAPAQIYPSGSRETGMLALMGIPAARGRLFTPDEQLRGPAVAVVSDRVWRGYFGGNPEVIGAAVRMNDDDVTVVGVMPPGIRPFDVDVWFPHRASLMPPMMLDRANHPGFGVVARLRPGVDVEHAQRELSAIASALERQYPASNTDMGVLVRPMIDAVAGTIRPTLRLLMTAVAVLLLIACANVANLLLAKGLKRERETSIRSALGARRSRIVRLFLIEGIALGSAGAVCGLLLAGWGVRLLRSVPGFTLPRASDVAIDPHVLGFAASLGILTAVVFALAPALQLSRVDLMRVLRQPGSCDGSNPRTIRLRAALVAGEVALLTVLLAGAALMQRSLANLASLDAGFDAARVLSVPLQQLDSRYGSEAAVSAFADRLLESIRRRPGVEGAAIAWPFDYTGFTWGPNLNLPDRPFDAGREPVAQTATVTPGYFAAMGIPLKEGRDFDARDRAGAPTTVIVNETFASRFFPGEHPLGRRVSAMRIPQMRDMTIVGVVGDTRRGGVLAGFTPEMYVPYAQFPQSGATLVVRGTGINPAALTGDLRTRIADIDPGTAVGSVRIVADALAQTYGDRRALSWLLV